MSIRHTISEGLPSNNRLKLTARGRSGVESRLRTRAAV
jgi:hypothetical protein